MKTRKEKLVIAALLGMVIGLSACNDEGINTGLGLNNLAATPENIEHSAWSGELPAYTTDTAGRLNGLKTTLDLDFIAHDTCRLTWTTEDRSYKIAATYTYFRPEVRIQVCDSSVWLNRGEYVGSVNGSTLSIDLKNAFNTVEMARTK